mmetsp:Transcript_15829/g.15255  ORF Transcript_15829/g.15255 Transcript_15829/m.15255 type:complete len:179 (-) Transcript_15829:403-939(-)|eukprot:CAMPEP_0170543730 /NCGR_PEP_ID=MMETSP0211-20121228/2751_1 /TAXON_ID=311385 /ORGANISM="Pseudokeronopsis sp., Strain OXSARD2" /LENGTH=178 /DNA_ID=CAMNT_0010847189 /DNA_START=534 /DNA_END=1070 /DNA_ORIENTATION=-
MPSIYTIQELNEPGSHSSDTTVVFRFKGREHIVYGDAVLSDEEAALIFEKLLANTGSGGEGAGKKQKKCGSHWEHEEVQILQWSVFTYALQKDRDIETLDQQDWLNIKELVPTKDSKACWKKWAQTQRKEVQVKLGWTQEEDALLRKLVQEMGPKEWNKISDQFDKTVGAEHIQRTGK